MAKDKQKTKILPKKGTILGFVIGTVIVVAIGYFAVVSMIPVNGDFPVFAAPTNIYIKTISTEDRSSVFASQSIKGGKTGGGPSGSHYPTLVVSEGNLVSIHFINEDTAGAGNYNHKHNLNIDEFNVHSNDLDHREAQTIMFLADKQGTFDYYDSIHPEMRGSIVVQ
ncbi:MAG: cupredoxin domain-containing protein [Nitrososphaerales archaeon]